MKRSYPFVCACALAGATLLCPVAARAADTVETWAVGATDVDFYLGFDGIRGEQGSSYGDIMLGYGIVERFSAYLGTTLEGSEDFGDGQATIYLGIFGTPIDFDHFDLDLFLNVSTGGPGLGEFELAPAIELNFDRDPDHGSWGTYLRASLPVHGREVAGPMIEVEPTIESTFHVGSTLGAYLTVADGHQLLVEYGMDFHPDAAEGERGVEMGGLGFGYNVGLNDTLELITQLYVDIPQQDERVEYGLMTGFIATLPSARR